MATRITPKRVDTHEISERWKTIETQKKQQHENESTKQKGATTPLKEVTVRKGGLNPEPDELSAKTISALGGFSS